MNNINSMKVLVNDKERYIFTVGTKQYMISESDDQKIIAYDFEIMGLGKTKVNKITLIKGQNRFQVRDSILDGTIEWFQH